MQVRTVKPKPARPLPPHPLDTRTLLRTRAPLLISRAVGRTAPEWGACRLGAPADRSRPNGDYGWRGRLDALTNRCERDAARRDVDLGERS
jgi:hypothetical protein